MCAYQNVWSQLRDACPHNLVVPVLRLQKNLHDLWVPKDRIHQRPSEVVILINFNSFDCWHFVIFDIQKFKITLCIYVSQMYYSSCITSSSNWWWHIPWTINMWNINTKNYFEYLNDTHYFTRASTVITLCQLTGLASVCRTSTNKASSLSSFFDFSRK